MKIYCPDHGDLYDPNGATVCLTEQVLDDIYKEREFQFNKYGANRGIPLAPENPWTVDVRTGATSAEDTEVVFRRDYELYEQAHGGITWMHLLREEFAETMVELYREELSLADLYDEAKQVAALAVSLMEKIKEGDFFMSKVVYFTAPWCAPCKKLKPKLLAFAQEAGIEVEEANIDKDDYAAKAQLFGVLGVPRIYVEATGELIDPTAMTWAQVKKKLLA